MAARDRWLSWWQRVGVVAELTNQEGLVDQRSSPFSIPSVPRARGLPTSLFYAFINWKKKPCTHGAQMLWPTVAPRKLDGKVKLRSLQSRLSLLDTGILSVIHSYHMCISHPAGLLNEQLARDKE